MNLKERNKSMQDFFDLKAEESYDDVHSVFMKTKAQIAENLPDGTKKILDLGGGTGLELIYIFERFPEADVTVIDISENMLKVLDRRPFADRVKKICGDFFETDFGDDYDAVISTSALHHFLRNDKKRLYEKIFRCLRPHGVFINSDKFASCPDEEAEWLRDYYENKDKRPHIDTPLSVATETALLAKAGFSECAVFDCDAEYYSVIKASAI